MPGWAPGDADDEEGPRGINERRQVLRLWLAESVTGLVMDVTTCFLSLLSVVTYVYEVRRPSRSLSPALSLSPLLLVHLSRLRTSSRRVIITCASLPHPTPSPQSLSCPHLALSPPCFVRGGEDSEGRDPVVSVPSVPFTYITYQHCGPPQLQQPLLSPISHMSHSPCESNTL